SATLFLLHLPIFFNFFQTLSLRFRYESYKKENTHQAKAGEGKEPNTHTDYIYIPWKKKSGCKIGRPIGECSYRHRLTTDMGRINLTDQYPYNRINRKGQAGNINA